MEKSFLKLVVFFAVIAICANFVQCQNEVDDIDHGFDDESDEPELRQGIVSILTNLFNRLCDRRCMMTCNSRGQDPIPCSRGRCTCKLRTSK